MLREKSKKIFSIVAIAVLLFPSVAKFEHIHTHNHFFHPDKNLYTQSHSHNCPICNFEYSSYLTQEDTALPEKQIKYCEKNEISAYFILSLPKIYSFGLRAPPVSLV